MSRIAYHSGNAVSTAAGVVLGVLVLGAAYNNSDIIPLTDGKILPVLQVDDVTDIMRERPSENYTTGRACFTMHLTKLRDAMPLPYRFTVATTYSPPIGISVSLANADNSRARSQAYEKHPVGSSWMRRYCFEMPGTIADEDSLTVSGVAFHRRHWGWDTETVLPAFGVPPAPPAAARKPK